MDKADKRLSVWRDSSTGINPFLPIGSKAAEAISNWEIIKDVVVAMLAIARAAVLLPLLLIWFGFDVISHRLIPFEYRRSVDLVIGRVILLLLGYSRIDSKFVTSGHVKDFHGDEQLRLQRYRPEETDKVQPGDLIIANHSSYIDLIVLKMMFSASFTKVSAFPPHQVYESSVFECLARQDRSIPDARLSSRTKLKGLLGKGKTSIVVFPEGSRTNGRALLRFIADFSDCNPNQRVHIVSLRHDNFGARSRSPAYPVFTTGRFLRHLWAMLNQWDNLLGVKVIPPTAVYKSDLPNPPSPDFKPALEKVLLEMTPHVRPSRFNMVDKLSFLRTFLNK